LGGEPECVRRLNDAIKFYALPVVQLNVTQDTFALLGSFKQLCDKPVAFVVIHSLPPFCAFPLEGALAVLPRQVVNG